MSTAIHLSGPVLVGGALLFGLTALLIASRPVIGATIPPDVASLMLGSAALLLLSLPAMYVVQADATGALGLVAHTLLSVGLLLLVLVAAKPLLQPSVNGPIGEHPLLFLLGIALTLGLLLTGIATFQADVFPRPRGGPPAGRDGRIPVRLLRRRVPAPAAGQLGTSIFGVLLALGFAWIGVALWLRSPAA